MTADRDTSKARQRVAARERRSVMTRDSRLAADLMIAQRLRQLVPATGVIAAYAANAEEVGLDAVLREWLAAGREVLLPRVTGPGQLALHRVRDLDVDLAPGRFGIREPAEDCPRGAVSAVTAALVPGVAFDRSGGRIGHGGGFYDRLLPTLSAAWTVGVCYEIQLVEAVVREPHDVAVDAVVTEGDVYR